MSDTKAPEAAAPSVAYDLVQNMVPFLDPHLLLALLDIFQPGVRCSSVAMLNVTLSFSMLWSDVR